MVDLVDCNNQRYLPNLKVRAYADRQEFGENSRDISISGSALERNDIY